MDFLFAYIQRKMTELGIKKYVTSIEYHTINASATTTIPSHNDYRFMASACSGGSSAVNGRIRAHNNSMNLNPEIMDTKAYKHSVSFFGELRMTNFNANHSLFIEFIVVTPILTNN